MSEQEAQDDWMKTVVQIEWDSPQEQHWLCADNIALALHSYCINTNFKVIEIGDIKTDLNLVKKELKNLQAEISHISKNEIDQKYLACCNIQLRNDLEKALVNLSLVIEALKQYADYENPCSGDYKPPNLARETLARLENKEEQEEA